MAQARSTGRLITLEGGEGAGKSTQIDTVAERVRELGHRVVVTREPGGTPIGESIRDVLMGDFAHPIPPMSELLLMFAARAAHLAQVIEPTLARGDWVICDRFTDASYAYQGEARGLGVDAVATLETLVQGERRPDGVLLFDLPVQTGLARAGKRGHGNRFDRETIGFHERVRRAYKARANAAPSRYCIIDAAQDRDTVARQIRDAVTSWA